MIRSFTFRIGNNFIFRPRCNIINLYCRRQKLPFLPKENNAPQAESAQTAPRTPVQTSNGGQAVPAPARVSVDNNFGVEVIRGT